MAKKVFRYSALAVVLSMAALYATAAYADGNLGNVNHIIVVMQENHSFDNYLGVLPLVPGSPYHSQNSATGSNGGCPTSDHLCVNSLNCTRDVMGNYTCQNFNVAADGTSIFSFHDKSYCPAPDLDHGWLSSHLEGNFSSPNLTSPPSPNDGFVRVNDATERGQQTTRDTMGFYDERDLAYYYALAQNFAIDDSYFCDVVGPTIPNRFYLMAATSFGHLTTNEFLPPAGGYKPITGTIFDLLDGRFALPQVGWVDYFSDLAQAGDFRNPVGPNFKGPDGLVSTSFKADTVDPLVCGLPPVALVDPILFGSAGNLSTDEHPPHDIRAGQNFVSQIVDDVRNGACWKDSIIFIVYDEHGGFYDHVAPAIANQNGSKTPDGIFPGQCADLSNPPFSKQPGAGANCSGNPFGTSSQQDALALCGPLYIPTGAASFTPSGPYPAYCAAFDSLGFRVPFIAVSRFSKPHYVSHTTGDHTSILALIEKRFLGGSFLTLRDQNANTLEDMFDFDNSPSASVSVSSTLATPPNLVTDGNGSCTKSTGLP